MQMPKRKCYSEPVIDPKPLKTINARRLLNYKYHTLYNRLSSYENCNDITKLSTFSFYCNLYHIPFKKIKNTVLDFINCTLNDKPKEMPKDKKLKNYHSTSKKRNRNNNSEYNY